MAAVTAEHTPVQGCRIESLGAMRYVAVGPSPDPAGPMIVYNRKDRLQHRFLTSMRQRVDPPIHYVPSAAAFIDAIRLGLGWGMVPESIARADIAAGRYVELFPGKKLDVPLYWQYWKIESAVLKELTAAVKAAAAEVLSR
jgi:LysR family transcriptional regulator (chromosome initiation inhibitor)